MTAQKYYQNPLYLLPTVETTDYTSDATDGYVFLAGAVQSVILRIQMM